MFQTQPIHRQQVRAPPQTADVLTEDYGLGYGLRDTSASNTHARRTVLMPDRRLEAYLAHFRAWSRRPRPTAGVEALWPEPTPCPEPALLSQLLWYY